jgi:hypothetical protein
MSLHKTLHTTLRQFLQARRDAALATSLLHIGTAHAAHYFESSIASHAEALQAAYPSVLALLGDAAFAVLARGFARATPDGHWDLNAYGADLPGWIRSEQPDADGALLAEVARLDWAMHRAAFAADAAPLDRAALARVDAARQAQLRLRPHPASALLASTQPLVSLWRSARDEAFVMPGRHAESALVGRDLQDRVWMRPIDPAEAAFVGSMLAGASLAEGVGAALQLEPGFDLPTLLQRQMADQVWSAFY